MTAKIYPRSPYATLGGYVHLPRLIDKARLSRKKLLRGYNYMTSGFDKLLLNFLRVDGKDFEEAANRFESDGQMLDWLRSKGINHTAAEIEAWNESMIAMRPDTPGKLAQFRHALSEVAGTDHPEVQTYFDLIDFEDRNER